MLLTGCSNAGDEKITDCTNREEELTWYEDGDLPPLNPCGAGTVGLEYREMDLSTPSVGRSLWYERGGETSLLSDLSQILGQPINTRDEAVEIANKILESESSPEMEIGQGIIGGLTLELMLVEHDPGQNIWILVYWENNVDLLSSSFHIAIDGNKGEIIRVWNE